MHIHIGCAGWSYKDWENSFYPKKISQSDHLSYYAKYFDLNEVNSTFYHVPSQTTVEGWFKKVPEDFLFIIKVWRKITHEISKEDLDSRVAEFFYRLRPLKPKIKAFLLQFPPRFDFSNKYINQLRYLIELLPGEYEYFIELRDNSWYNEDILSEIAQNQIFIVTSYLKDLTPYYQEQEKLYIRLIGDRTLSTFNRIQREKKEEIIAILKKINKIKEQRRIREIFIIVNNHFTGFAPETANLIKKRLGIPIKKFKKQKTLLDFS